MKKTARKFTNDNIQYRIQINAKHEYLIAVHLIQPPLERVCVCVREREREREREKETEKETEKERTVDKKYIV